MPLLSRQAPTLDPVVVQEACRFDVTLISPASGAVQVRVHPKIQARDIQEQNKETAQCDHGPNAKRLGKERMIARLLPVVRPDEKDQGG